MRTCRRVDPSASRTTYSTDSPRKALLDHPSQLPPPRPSRSPAAGSARATCSGRTATTTGVASSRTSDVSTVSSPTVNATRCRPSVAGPRVIPSRKFDPPMKSATNRDRLAVDLLGCARTARIVLAHHGDPVRHRQRLDLVVGHVDRGDAELGCSRCSSSRICSRSLASRFDSGSSSSSICGSRRPARAPAPGAAAGRRTAGSPAAA